MFVVDQEIGNLSCRVLIDSDPCNPRKEWDHYTHLWAWHSRYALGDDDTPSSPVTVDAIVDQFKRQGDPVVALKPVYLYDHSGITINTTGFSCPWDSGCVGVIFMTRSQYREVTGRQNLTAKGREQALKALDTDVETFDQYLRGEVYGYEILEGDEVIESCWGFFGSSDYVLQEAVDAAKHMTQEAA